MNNVKDIDMGNITKDNDEYSYFFNFYSDFYNDIMNKMCHEINNPLTLISSTLQLIELQYPEVKDIKYWNQLTLDVTYSIELIKSFKEFGNCVSVEISNGNLLELIESAVNSLLPLAEKYNAHLILSIDESSKQYYTNYPFDKIRLKQALTNIIKNSIEATPPGGYIVISCSSDETNLIIDIKNDGEPISKESQTEIFNPNFTSKESGSGLGLPISKSIILSHMGNIRDRKSVV